MIADPAAPSPDIAPDADLIATVVRAVPGVVDLHGGAYGEAATYLPGRRVVGVEVGEERVAIHIVAALPPASAGGGSDLETLATEVRRAAAPLCAGLRIDVFVEDLRETDG